MGPVNPQMGVQLKKPAILYQYRRVNMEKSCQATIYNKKQRKCEYDDFKSQSSKCSDKNCQENENINMHSVANTDNMWLPIPAIRRLLEFFVVRRPVNLQDSTRKESSETNVQL